MTVVTHTPCKGGLQEEVALGILQGDLIHRLMSSPVYLKAKIKDMYISRPEGSFPYFQSTCMGDMQENIALAIVVQQGVTICCEGLAIIIKVKLYWAWLVLGWVTIPFETT